MREESGRSLLEIVGVMAIGAIMTASAISMYNMIRNNQKRAVALAQLEQIVRDARLLMGVRDDYSGISVDYLIQAGALKSDKAPIGGEWSIRATFDGKYFYIDLTDLSMGECDYFVTIRPEWTTQMFVNGVPWERAEQSCFSSDANMLSFMVD